MSVNVTSEITVYELNGEEILDCRKLTISVQSHTTKNRSVVVVVDGSRFTVRARDLQVAIENATNNAS